jgi:hypothetical protein
MTTAAVLISAGALVPTQLDTPAGDIQQHHTSK